MLASKCLINYAKRTVLKHGEPVLPKCNSNQVSVLLHYALEDLIYRNSGLWVTKLFASESLDKGRRDEN